MSNDVSDAMTWQEVCAALKIKRATFFKMQARGLLDRFRLVPSIGDPRYSRKAVQAYLDRENTLRPSKAIH